MARGEEQTLMGPGKLSRKRRRREGQEEKYYGRQGFNKKQNITIIFYMANIYRVLTIFQTVPYTRDLNKSSERPMRQVLLLSPLHR